MSLEQVVLNSIVKERIISEVSKKFELPIEVCNMIYDFSQEYTDDITKEKADLPSRPKFKNGDIYDPNITPNEKPFYNIVLTKEK
jgi:hypothetical protein